MVKASRRQSRGVVWDNKLLWIDPKIKLFHIMIEMSPISQCLYHSGDMAYMQYGVETVDYNRVVFSWSKL
jgi:hypothetical protein